MWLLVASYKSELSVKLCTHRSCISTKSLLLLLFIPPVLLTLIPLRFLLQHRRLWCWNLNSWNGEQASNTNTQHPEVNLTNFNFIGSRFVVVHRGNNYTRRADLLFTTLFLLFMFHRVNERTYSYSSESCSPTQIWDDVEKEKLNA